MDGQGAKRGRVSVDEVKCSRRAYDPETPEMKQSVDNSHSLVSYHDLDNHKVFLSSGWSDWWVSYPALRGKPR